MRGDLNTVGGALAEFRKVGARLRAMGFSESPASGLLQRKRLASRAFTLLEVLLAVALFAIAVVMLAGAYINVLDGMESVRTDRAFEQELRWIREKVLLEPALEEVEEGGEAPTPDFGMARWEVVIEPTEIADLFLITLHVTMEGNDDQPTREVHEQFMLLRPAWSEPLDRDKLRSESRTRIEEQRRHRGVLARRES